MSEKRDTLPINARIHGKEAMADIMPVFTISKPTVVNKKTDHGCDTHKSSQTCTLPLSFILISTEEPAVGEILET